MLDAVKNYLALASGLTEVTRQRALAAAKALVASGEATAEQVTNLADDLLTTSRDNRDTVLALVRYEIDRALTRLGLATSEEIAALAQRIETVEAGLKATKASPVPAPSVPATPDILAVPGAAEGLGAALNRPAKKATKSARKAPARRSPAKRLPAKRVAGGTGATPRVAASQPASPVVVPPVKAAAKKAATKKAATVKAAPKKAVPAKKAAAAKKPAPRRGTTPPAGTS